MLAACKDGLIVAGVLLLVWGMRISEGIRVVTSLPQGDDSRVLSFLQKLSLGSFDWSLIWQRPNGHFFVLYYLINALEFKLNGYWDPYLDFLTFSLIHTIEAAMVLFTFRAVLTRKDRWWLYGLILFLFAVPFGGYRIGWGNLYAYSNVIVFALPVIYGSVYGLRSWASAAGLLILAALGSLNIAAGCLGALAASVLTIFRGVVNRRLTPKEIVFSFLAFLLFASIFATMPKTTDAKIGLLEAINAFLRSIAWPVIVSPLAGLTTLVPMAALVLSYLRFPSFRRPNVEFVIGASILACLLALATGAFRGDNGGVGMPSGRYVDLFLMVPLTGLISLCFLCRGNQGAARNGWAIYTWFWCALQVFGFSIFLLYRTLPFIAKETGEWVEPAKLATYRAAAADHSLPLYYPGDPLYDGSLDLPAELGPAYVHGQEPVPAMTSPMITGFPLLPGTGNYLQNGYPSIYTPRPADIYIGSFDPAHRRVPKSFISRPFTPSAPYIIMDLMMNKTAHFNFYRLPGLTLTLVDQTDGSRLPLLPRLENTFPYFLRDLESVYAPVIPGHTYALESTATDARSDQWIAFSEPMESGRLTPFVVGLEESGKLFSLLAMGLLVFAAGLPGKRLGLFGEPDADGLDTSSPASSRR